MTDESLFVGTVEIRRYVGTGREFLRKTQIPELSAGGFEVVDGVLDLALTIEAVTEGVAVHGVVTGRWRGPCRRCLDEIDGPIKVEIDEIFETKPAEGETWPLGDDGIDLAPLLRESTLLALPMAPLCRVDCEGPEPQRFPTGVADEDPQAQRDPRWSALDDLTFDD